MKNLKSTNLQLIGFFETKKPIICKIVDSVHSSINYILETVPYLYQFNSSLLRWEPPDTLNIPTALDTLWMLQYFTIMWTISAGIPPHQWRVQAPICCPMKIKIMSIKFFYIKWRLTSSSSFTVFSIAIETTLFCKTRFQKSPTVDSNGWCVAIYLLL